MYFMSYPHTNSCTYSSNASTDITTKLIDYMYYADSVCCNFICNKTLQGSPINCLDLTSHGH